MFMENGVYNGSDKYSSGKIKVDEFTIKDWNNTGWGTITYDYGYAVSSNVGVVDIIKEYLNAPDFLKIEK